MAQAFLDRRQNFPVAAGLAIDDAVRMQSDARQALARKDRARAGTKKRPPEARENAATKRADVAAYSAAGPASITS